MQLFSHHSSNPLEAHSSDNLNADYNRLYTTAVSQQRAGIHLPSDCILLSSEDPLHGYDAPDQYLQVKNYQQHVADVVNIIDEDIEMKEQDDEQEEQRDDEQDERDDEQEEQREEQRYSSPLFSSPLTPLSSLPSSPVSSRPQSPTESLSARPQEEQEEIIQEISHLNAAIPFLAENYLVIDRLGTGTFSSVYKAIDLRYDEWDNKPWKGNHPPESSAYYQSVGPGYRGRGGRGPGIGKDKGKGKDKARENKDSNAMAVDFAEASGEAPESKVYVAIKLIYTTSGPDRIRNELIIMQSCRGCRHTSQIITAYRHLDQVALVLPYHRNMDFRVGICIFFYSLLFAIFIGMNRIFIRPYL
jgi:cell division control protein 7